MKRVSSALIAGSLAPRIDQPTSLGRQLYDTLRAQILQGRFGPGYRMPSTRVLAADLGVSRNTILQAFEQLRAEGYLRGAVGSGTFVADPLPDELVHASRSIRSPRNAQRPEKQIWSEFGLRITTPEAYPVGTAHYRPFEPGQPALDAFPFDVWMRLFTRFRKPTPVKLLAYGSASGYEPLRKAISSYLALARGVRCAPEQVIVVSGAQQALDLIARLLLNPGDSVVLEEPGYRGAHVAFQAAAANIVPVPVDEEGLDTSQVVAMGDNASLVYTTPSHQYPLGTTMGTQRRSELLEWAARSGAWIVEDDYDSEFCYLNRPVPALQSMDKAGSVILLGTFSKVLFPSLRLGYLVVPPKLVEGFVRAKAVTDYHCPTLDQAAVAEFIEEGHFGRHIRRMRGLYLERLEALLESAKVELGSLVKVTRPDAGMHIVARLDAGIDDVKLANVAAHHGVSTTPLSLCYINSPVSSGLLLGYPGYSPRQIHAGMRKLSAAFIDSRLF